MQSGGSMPAASGVTLGTADTNLKVVMNSGIPTIDTNLNAVMQSGGSMPAASGVTLGTADTNLKVVMNSGIPTIDTNLKAVMNTGVATADNLASTGVKLQDGTYNVDLKIVQASGVVTSLVSGTSTTPHTFDLSTANSFTYTLATNPTVFHLANVTQGQKFIIRIEQDSGGGNDITWFSTIKWAGGSAPTETTTGGKADVFGFIAIETGLYDGFVIGQNI
jgi:hypothetical protein